MDAHELVDPMKRARFLADGIAISLASEVAEASLPTKSKLPFKILSLREVLFHRTSALSSPAIKLIEEGNSIGGALLTRAVMETVAVMAALQSKLENFLKNPQPDSLANFLRRVLHGSRRVIDGVPDKIQAMNVLNFVDELDKQFEGYRETYDMLSEYAHPNYDGVQGSFGTIDPNNRVLILGAKENSNGNVIASLALAMSLEILIDCYESMPETMTAVFEHFEPGWRDRV